MTSHSRIARAVLGQRSHAHGRVTTEMGGYIQHQVRPPVNFYARLVVNAVLLHKKVKCSELKLLKGPNRRNGRLSAGTSGLVSAGRHKVRNSPP